MEKDIVRSKSENNRCCGSDFLTGLYTRQELYEIYETVDKNERFHFMFMDLDNFKNVNDAYGHKTGDELLKSVAGILTSVLPQTKVVRLGGDEFVLLCQANASRAYLAESAQQIINRVTAREGFEEVSIAVSASVGILYNRTFAETLDEILVMGDIAMYYAKNHGKGQYVFYEDVEESVLEERRMEKAQEHALENHEFELHFLPVYSPQTSKLLMTQVRLFWRQQDGSYIGQYKFMPLFERNGFSRKIDLWSLEQLCSIWGQRRAMLGFSTRVGIRVSRGLIMEADFPERLEQIAIKNGLQTGDLVIEVSETNFGRGSAAVLYGMNQLKEKGFGIAIIDVGQDFHSMKYWDEISWDTIIFDVNYMQHSLGSARGQQMIKMLLVAARELKMQAFVVGINDEEHVEFLQRCGCNGLCHMQFSQAIQIEEYLELVKDRVVLGENQYAFRFKDNLLTEDEKHKGEMRGTGVSYIPGINDDWGALHFPGGKQMQNVVELPAELLAESCYTICMWLRSDRNIGWSGALYARYRGCFVSFVPYTEGGNHIYRVRDDSDINGWHDILARNIPLNIWTFVCITYDDKTSTTRCYINGRKAGFLGDIPSLMACRQIIIGGDPFQPSFEGDISGLIIYSGVKSEEEIGNLYQEFCDAPGFRGSKEDFWME